MHQFDLLTAFEVIKVIYSVSRLDLTTHPVYLCDILLHCYICRHSNCLCAWRRSLVRRLVGGWLDAVGFAPLRIARRPDGGGVERTPLEDSVSQEAAGLPVLVTQQWVDERVACRLAVGQTFGQHAPVRAYGLRPEELYNSTSNQAQREGKKVTHHPESEPILRSA